eukprot:8776411-Pyramimonas_sp.AAC.3
MLAEVDGRPLQADGARSRPTPPSLLFTSPLKLQIAPLLTPTPWQDYDDGSPQAAADPSITTVAIVTAQGSINITLRPEWSASSVEFVRKVAAHDYCTFNCVFYRAEPGFLLQVPP